MVTRLRSGSQLCTKSMSSTCQTIHYDASQYRVYIPVYNFVFVLPKSQWQGPRYVLFLCAIGQCLPQGASLEVSLPPIFLPPTLLPCSSPRSLPPLFPSLRPCPRSVLTRSLSQPSLPHFRSHPPSHHRFLTPCPCSLPPPSSSCSLPSSILPRSFPASPCLPASRCPIQCTPYVCLASCTVLCST